MAPFPRCVAACTTVLAALLAATGIVGVRAADTAGTTPHFKEIFLGRCWEYQHIINPTAFTESGKKNCTKLYMLFEAAFSNRFPCDVPVNRFDDFVIAASHPVEANKSLFWEGVYELVHMYSYHGKRFTTISDTLSGYLANKLQWCGKASGGIDEEVCPDYGSCKEEVSRSFWRSASRQYAKMAQGTVYVMFNGTRKHAYNPTSVFSQYELVNINSSRVSLFNAMLIHDIGMQASEHCGMGSLLRLQHKVEDLGIEFRCTDDPASVRHLLCVDNEDALECQGISNALRSTSSIILNILAISVYLLMLGS